MSCDGSYWQMDYSGSDTKASDYSDPMDALDAALERMTEQRAREGLDAPLEKSWCESIVSVSGDHRETSCPY